MHHLRDWIGVLLSLLGRGLLVSPQLELEVTAGKGDAIAPPQAGDDHSPDLQHIQKQILSRGYSDDSIPLITLFVKY